MIDDERGASLSLMSYTRTLGMVASAFGAS